MKAQYYCTKCDVHLEEEGIPNINKRHYCGEFLRIQSFEDKERSEE